MSASPQKTYPEQDYEILVEALSETGRGRWFLEQYLKRNAPQSHHSHTIVEDLERINAFVENQEAAMRTQLQGEDFILVKQALAIVENALKLDDNSMLSSASKDLSQSASTLENASENLFLAAANLKMGHVSDDVFAQILSEAERVQDARLISLKAKQKIAALYKLLGLLETHLRKISQNDDHKIAKKPEDSDAKESDQAFDSSPKAQNNDEVSEFTPVKQDEVFEAETSVINETNENNADQHIEAEHVDPGNLSDQRHDQKPIVNGSEDKGTANKDDSDDHDDPDSGLTLAEESSDDQMSEEEIEALFANRDIQEAEMPLKPAQDTKTHGETYNFSKKINSLLKHVAQEQYAFFANLQPKNI